MNLKIRIFNEKRGMNSQAKDVFVGYFRGTNFCESAYSLNFSILWKLTFAIWPFQNISRKKKIRNFVIQSSFCSGFLWFSRENMSKNCVSSPKKLWKEKEYYWSHFFRYILCTLTPDTIINFLLFSLPIHFSVPDNRHPVSKWMKHEIKALYWNNLSLLRDTHRNIFFILSPIPFC